MQNKVCQQYGEVCRILAIFWQGVHWANELPHCAGDRRRRISALSVLESGGKPRLARAIGVVPCRAAEREGQLITCCLSGSDAAKLAQEWPGMGGKPPSAKLGLSNV